MNCAAVVIALAMLFSAAPARSADPIGRFFFTPAQRTKLDAARSEHARGLATPEPAEAAPPPKTVTYNGMVRRSDGKSTVWINRRPVQREDPTGVAVERVRPDGAVTLKVPQTNRDVQLKVGQTMDVVSGTIEEPFERRGAARKSATNGQTPSESSMRNTRVGPDKFDGSPGPVPSPSVNGNAAKRAAEKPSSSN